MWSVVALVALAVVPGVALGGILARWDKPDPGSDTLLVRCASMALVAWTLTSLFLARTVGITSDSVWWAASVVCLAGIVGLVWQRRSLWSHRWSLAYGLAVTVLAALVFAPVLALTLRTSWGPVGATPWYYWNLAEQIAASGTVPRLSTEWGVQVPFLADYQAFSAATASLIAVGDGMAAVRTVIVVSVIVAALAIVTVSREFGASRGSALIAVPLFLSVTVFATKFSGYRPESFAYALGLLIAANAIGWLRRGDKGALVSAAGLAAVLSQVHLIVGLITALILAGLVVALVVEARPLRPTLARMIALSLGCVAGAAIVAVAAGRSATALNLEPVGSAVADPTWEFNVAIQGLPYVQPPSGLQLAPPWVLDGFTLAPGWPYWALIAITLGSALLLSLRGHADVRRALITAVVFWILVLIVVTVIVTQWDTFVPRRTGGHRSIQLAPIMLPVLVAVVVSAFQSRLRWWGVAAAVTFASAFGFLSSAAAADLAQSQRPSESTVARLEALSLPTDSTVLVNAYTEGIIERTLGAEGLLEGRAPYTFPPLLARANHQLRDAQRFFANPVAEADILDHYDVDLVLVSQRRWALATGYQFKVNADLIKRQTRLEPIETFDGAVLYRVVKRGD